MSDKKAEAVSAERLDHLIRYYEALLYQKHDQYNDLAAALRELQSLRFKVIDLEAEVEHNKDMVHILTTALAEAEAEVDELDRQLYGESELDEDDNTEILDTRGLLQ